MEQCWQSRKLGNKDSFFFCGSGGYNENSCSHIGVPRLSSLALELPHQQFETALKKQKAALPITQAESRKKIFHFKTGLMESAFIATRKLK